MLIKCTKLLMVWQVFSYCVQGGAMCRIYFKIIFMGFTLLFSNVSFAGKKQCEPYLDNLRNIQSQQKQGHSLKRGERLNKLETKARKNWWQCEQGKLKKAKRSKNQKKQQKNKIVTRRSLSTISLTHVTKENIEPFKTSTPLVMKSRYQGKQLQAWLLYYQQPKKCSRPKTTKQFAFCVENRRTQQLAFEKVDATVSIQ
jgi:hypothetical protein